MIYRIYAFGLQGYELVAYAYSDEQVRWCINQLDRTIYSRTIVIKHDVELNQDTPYDMIDLNMTKCHELKRTRQKQGKLTE